VTLPPAVSIAAPITGALTAVFEPVAREILGLVTFRDDLRDDLRARLRQATPAGLPVLNEAGAMIASYLTAERQLGRISPDADVDTLALTLIGAGHLLFAGRKVRCQRLRLSTRS
jgi:hypothetical protein